MNHHVKHATLRGRITEVWAQEGYGRITTEDGVEYLFDRRDFLKDGFDQALVGMEATFEPEAAPDLPRARHVCLAR